MPVIKLWCLPKTEEENLNRIHQSIVRAVASIEEIGVSDEKDITCLFVPDMMQYGLGTEIIVEVTGLFEKPERTDEVRQRLAAALGDVIRDYFPNADLAECFVYPFERKQGYWSSRE